MEELKYGLQRDKLVHIDSVEKGLACNCVCPHCMGQLIAKKGEKRAKHFAHYKQADCNHGTETALHLMAKEIVANTRQVFVPYLPKTEYDQSQSGKVLTFENAVLEKQLSQNVRGDVVLNRGDSFLNVEIKVTHKVDDDKVRELFNLGIPTIEIDLSDLKSDFTPELVGRSILDQNRVRLLKSPKNKPIFAKWILGEWKKVYSFRYVDECPRSRQKAYFIDDRGRGGYAECHECEAFISYDGGDKLLCYGCLDNIDFRKVDKIIHLVKEENHICEVELHLNDGSVIKRKSNIRKQ